MATITTINASDQITNSRADINANFSALNTDKIETSVIDTDTALAANSDAKIPSQKAVKAYVDSVGVATATTAIKGVVEIATQAEVDAGTATGATGASVVVTPATLKASQIPIVRTYLNAASPATWTKPSGLKYVVVEVQAAGGNGANVTSTDQGGGGGGGGGYSKKTIAATNLGSTETVTIGAVGANSSFGSHATANCGTSATNNSANHAAGGTSASGDLNIPGGDGGDGVSTNTARGHGGHGGNSVLGSGGGSVGAAADGLAGSGYGGGGSGGVANGTTDQNGGAGAPAIVIVTEYY